MNGKWIWRNGRTDEDLYGEFKELFFWREGKVFLEISADSEYAVFVNGKFVYGGQYADFPWYKIYDRIDISKFLTSGENECSVWVWYCGDSNFCHYVNRPAVRFSIVKEGVVLAESGEKTLSRALPHFVCGLKKKINALIGYSFAIDFTAKEENFSSSVAVAGMPEKVFERPASLLSVHDRAFARQISEKIYDLGKETVGLFFMCFKSPKGEKLAVSFGEHLEDGCVRRIIDDRDFSFSVTGDGSVRFVFNPLRKLGCRYFEVEGNVEISEIGLLPLEYPFQERTFKSGNVLQQKIYETSLRTLRLNAFEHYCDCPWREQAFYALDSCLQMRYGYSAFENTEYQYAALKLMSEDKNTSGLVSIVVPTSNLLVIPSFALFYIVAMEEYASFTKDLRLVKEYFERLKGIVTVFENNMRDGLVQIFKGKDFWNFYEWNVGLDGGTNECDSAINFTFLLALKSFIKICDMLEKASEKERCDVLYREIVEQINARFYDEEKGLYRFSEEDGRYFELVNVYAVLTETIAGEKAIELCERLVEKDKGIITCTLSMLAFKYDALLYVDEKKYGEYILADIEKHYGYMLERGATSFWETLKGADDFNGAGSLCHGWSALPIFYYYKLLKSG